ncbi:cysteine desulfurase [Ornithinimicrobium faecis]|uniref:Cysteine desulfurase n=1 Tax=Ornithinimicrobium faecis TaxID=2934158 RepID=A0ABY4YX60_9MICO|nr:cysteine desulfurase family protein [Ornithinimicrobium sp. HY1793]USQ81369.1 cysteine desulfurase [Ornithinimicrobium sp. HY1793]
MSTVAADRAGAGVVYLDHNATTPVDASVLDALLPWLSEGFGNPSSTYARGVAAREALEDARGRVAAFVGAASEEVVFTGSGSEADLLAVRGAVLGLHPAGPARPHVVTQATEHPAVLAACDELQQWHGVDVTVLPVDQHGQVTAASVAEAITPATVLVSIMHANNETGTLQPIQDIAAVTRESGVLLHTDAAQSAGKMALDVAELGVDLMTIVGHKMYAPKGIAALYVRDGVALHPVIGGGGQERGLRAGTENVAFAVGMGRAADLAADALTRGESARLTRLRDLLEEHLSALLPGRVHLNGHRDQRLPNTLNVSIDGTRALSMLPHLDLVAASAGSACHAGQDRPSPVLEAMGLSPERALGAIRLSVGRWTTEADVVTSARAIADAAGR